MYNVLSAKGQREALLEAIAAKREIAFRKARKDFWTFCKLLHPSFYKEDRHYLKALCRALQDFYEGKIDKKILIINMPPRHGKSFTARNFVLWMFGRDKFLKIITASYNTTLSDLFAQQTRDAILEQNDNLKVDVFQDIFPGVTIKYGDAAKGFWSLEGSPEKNYLSTSPNGTSTGIGANFLLVDDIIKDAKEAYNDRVLSEIWDWFNNTLVSRMERPRKIIMIMTRWSKNDLCGKLLKSRPNDIYHINYKAVNEDGSMLCDDVLTYEEFKTVTADMNETIIQANYQQQPIEAKGRLYKRFKTYTEIPQGERLGRFSYTDTADKGSDDLVTFAFEVVDGEAYILDAFKSNEPMEVTEPATAEIIHRNRVNQAIIESNNGGRGFARTIEKILGSHPDNITQVAWFHQSQNKEARILAAATWVMNHVYFPEGWEVTYSDVYEALTNYQRIGKNEHDDVPDALTGVCEVILGQLDLETSDDIEEQIEAVQDFVF